VATLRPFAIRRMASLTTRENTFALIVGRLDILWMYVTRSMVFHPRPSMQRPRIVIPKLTKKKKI